jgi:hypothetical protein
MSWLWRALLLLAVIFVVIQFVRPARTNPSANPQHEVTVVLPVDATVAETFQRSCYDCHSNRTVWPKYSHVAPASWLVAYDVSRGRKSMNFSEWASYPPKESRKLLGEICKEVSEGEMPGFPYSLLHPRAKLTSTDVQQVCRWTKTAAAQTERGDAAPSHGE